MLRPTPADAADPLETACFPLVPYANRIANGAFDFGGKAIRLPRNFGDHPHPLHGTGWRSAWQIDDATDSSVRLVHRHRRDAAWPWDFTADQMITLGPDGLRIVLTVRSEDEHAMPAGLGFHPYFRRTPETRFRARLSAAWDADDRMLPVRREPAAHFGDWTGGDSVERPALVDHCHEGWDGIADIVERDRTIRITADGAGWLHLFMPPGESFFCVEPVSHLPDAVQRADTGLRILAPGEQMVMAMTIGLLPRS